MWSPRRRPDPAAAAAAADAVMLVALLGEAAYDHARQQFDAERNGDAGETWPIGHWLRVQQAIRSRLKDREARDG